MKKLPPKMAVTSGYYTSYAHRILWDSAQRHLELATQHPDDAWALHLSAGLLAAAAFEAYLNYVGEEILPQVWEEERSFFNTAQYRGTDGKLKRIAEEIGLTLPARGRKPYSGVLSLQKLRDKLVHARTERHSIRVKHRAGTLPPTPSSWLQEEAHPKRIRGYITDVEELTVTLHNELMQSEFRFVIFGAHPFIGMLGGGTFWVGEPDQSDQ